MRTPARYRHQPYAALAHPSFRRFVLSLLAMTMAAQLQAVVIAWYVFRLTRDPLVLGLLGLAEVVPYAGVALVAGYVSAVNAIFVGSLNELGAFESGVTARIMGVVPAVVFGGRDDACDSCACRVARTCSSPARGHFALDAGLTLLR